MKRAHAGKFLRKFSNDSLLLSGLLLLLVLGGCSDGENTDPAPNPAIDGCLDYSQYSKYSYAPMAGTADWFNGARGVATRGDRVYVAGGRFGLQIFDISDPAAPVMLSSLQFPSAARALEVSVLGDYAYVLDFDTDEGSLRVVDISNSYSPRIVRTLAVPAGYYGLDIVWPCAYVARGGLGMAVFDISRPAQTKQVGQIELSGSVEDLAVDGGFAYCLVRGAVLEVVDVRDPGNLSVISRVSSAPSYAWAQGIDVADGLAAMNGDSLRIIDVSSPRSPRFVASLGVWGRDVVLSNQRALVIDEDKMLMTEVDVSNPVDPVVSAVLELPRCPSYNHGSTSSLTTDDTYAYLAVSGYGFQIVDVSVPGAPVLLAHCTPMGPTLDVAYLDGYAYVSCDNNGLAVFEVDGPDPTRLVGRITDPIGLSSLVEEDGWIYALGNEGLFVLDASDPTSPRVAGSIATELYGSVLDVQGEMACAARSGYSLVLIDVSNPATPAIVGEGSVPGRPRLVCLSNGFAYVAINSVGLAVVDVDPPGEAAVVAVLETTDDATAMTIDGERLFLAAGEIYVVDIADPADPTILGVSSDRFSGATGLLAADGLLYAKSQYYMQVCDVSDPALPVGETVLLHGGYSNFPGGLALAAETVLIANGTSNVSKAAGLGLMWRNCGNDSGQDSKALTGP